MFGLFKRKYVTATEQELLKNIFKSLGEEYSTYANQVQEGLLNRVFFQSTPFNNYVGFSYNDVANRFEDKKAPPFLVRGIRVFDKTKNDFIEVRVYLSFGLIAGYSTPDTSKPDFDPIKVQVKGFVRQLFENDDYKKLSQVLTKSELQLINSGEVYEITLKGKTLYHIKDLEDGDFIAIDLNKKVYTVTHDPYEIVELNKSLTEVI